jgi:hypothetical protein
MPCVYTLPAGFCDGSAPLSKREHYLPRGLGNFKHDPRLVDKICNKCQGKFSQAEDVFLHNSSEAFFREMVGQLGRKHHRKKNIFSEPTMGVPPLTIVGKHADDKFEILWELIEEGRCSPLKQIVVMGTNDTLRLPFRPGAWSIETIEKLMKKQNIGKPKDVLFVSNDPEETEEMQQLCAALLPGGTDRDISLPADGVQMEGQMLAVISPEYLRAIAKIGFHFFLQYFVRFSGLELEFDAIKRFIYPGEADRQRVSVINENFVLNLRNATLRRWSHLLSAQADENGIEARMQFFAGPPVQPLIWRVLIGENPSRIIYRESAGYAYVYYDLVMGEYVGERSELARTRGG